MDRRIKKSKRAIESGLIELMREKEFDKITINAIADKADVSRGTIYLNYEDKYQILEKCMENELTKLMDSCSPGEDDLNSQSLLMSTLNYIENNSNVFITLFEDKGVQTFRSKLLDLVKEHMMSDIKLTGINKEMNKEIFINFWSAAIIGIIEWWVKTEMVHSREEIAKHLFDILSRNELVPPEVNNNKKRSI